MTRATHSTPDRDRSPASPRLARQERVNVADHFLHARVRDGQGHRTALICDGQPHTYSEVAQHTARWAHALTDAGIAREQRVMLALPDGLDFVAAFFASLGLGAVVVMANPELATQALDDLIDHARARVLVCGPGRPPARVETTLTPDKLKPSEIAQSPLPTVDTHGDESAIWLFSGGTTGLPKVVMQSHASFVFSTRAYAHGVLGLGPEDKTISVPRLFFGYATGSNLLFPFSVGATAILDSQRCTAQRLCQQIAEHRATVLINVPTMVGKILAHADEHPGIDLSSLRLATSAGEALPEGLHARWNERFGVELLDGLGTAEMWHVFISNRPGAVKPGTLGKVVDGFEIRVCDDDGHQLADGEIGWLEVRGGARALGYWLAHEASCNSFRGPWYRSGDMVRRDANGHVEYCGRGDDMMKISGKWLAPREVESRLVDHAAVRDAVVVGAQDAQGLVKAYAFVITDVAVQAQELRAHVVERLDHYKAPREFYRVEAFPLTHLGKADRALLRSWVGSSKFPRS